MGDGEAGEGGRLPRGCGPALEAGDFVVLANLSVGFNLKAHTLFFFTSVCAVGIKRPDSGARQLGFEPHLCPLLV